MKHGSLACLYPWTFNLFFILKLSPFEDLCPYTAVYLGLSHGCHVSSSARQICNTSTSGHARGWPHVSWSENNLPVVNAHPLSLSVCPSKKMSGCDSTTAVVWSLLSCCVRVPSRNVVRDSHQQHHDSVAAHVCEVSSWKFCGQF